MKTRTEHKQLQSCTQDVSIERLYKTTFPSVARFVGKLNGTLDDAKDLFQDALIVYLERREDAHAPVILEPEPFILGIAKHLWMRKFRQTKHLVRFDAYEAGLLLPDDFLPTMLTSKLSELLERTGRKCMDLLRAFYYQKSPMNLIAEEYGFRSHHSATVQKYKCMEKVRQTIRDKSLTYEDFFE